VQEIGVDQIETAFNDSTPKTPFQAVNKGKCDIDGYWQIAKDKPVVNHPKFNILLQASLRASKSI
jgi:hypothetical protein